MSFHHMMLTPDQVRLVQRVFRDVIAQSWFDRSFDNEQACARLVIHIYQRGIVSEHAFSDQCREQARKRFAASPADISGTPGGRESMPPASPVIREATKVALSH
jgi:hypothetical protein